MLLFQQIGNSTGPFAMFGAEIKIFVTMWSGKPISCCLFKYFSVQRVVSHLLAFLYSKLVFGGQL